MRNKVETKRRGVREEKENRKSNAKTPSKCKMTINRCVAVRISHSSRHRLHIYILLGETPTFIPPKHIPTVMAKPG